MGSGQLDRFYFSENKQGREVFYKSQKPAVWFEIEKLSNQT